MRQFTLLLLLFVLTACTTSRKLKSPYPFMPKNLIPWSIVAFDSQERGPEERIAMVKGQGFSRYAFGGNEKHCVRMREEWQMAQAQGLGISAVWLFLNHAKDKPGQLKPHSENILSALRDTGLKTQIWIGFHKEYFAGLNQEEALRRAVEMVGYLAERTKPLGCKIALYNHGGWFGEPENQLAILSALPQHDIGVIYNFHHGHEHIDRFDTLIKDLLPHLWAVNLNGMRPEGPKIITIGQGTHEKRMIQTLLDAGYQGPFGILGHVKGGDAALVLEANRTGLLELFPDKNWR